METCRKRGDISSLGSRFKVQGSRFKVFSFRVFKFPVSSIKYYAEGPPS